MAICSSTSDGRRAATSLRTNQKHQAQIRDLLVEDDGSVWATNMDELVRLKDGKRENLSIRNGLPCDGIFALVKDASEAIWLYTKCGIIEIEKTELDRWWANPATLSPTS